MNQRLHQANAELQLGRYRSQKGLGALEFYAGIGDSRG